MLPRDGTRWFNLWSAKLQHLMIHSSNPIFSWSNLISLIFFCDGARQGDWNLTSGVYNDNLENDFATGGNVTSFPLVYSKCLAQHISIRASRASLHTEWITIVRIALNRSFLMCRIHGSKYRELNRVKWLVSKSGYPISFAESLTQFSQSGRLRTSPTGLLGGVLKRLIGCRG